MPLLLRCYSLEEDIVDHTHTNYTLTVLVSLPCEGIGQTDTGQYSWGSEPLLGAPAPLQIDLLCSAMALFVGGCKCSGKAFGPVGASP